VLKSSPVVRFLPRTERERDEEELRRVEDRREEEAGEIAELDPLPIRDSATFHESVRMARTTSDEPLLNHLSLGSSGR
jgi:hypothetical protein